MKRKIPTYIEKVKEAQANIEVQIAKRLFSFNKAVEAFDIHTSNAEAAEILNYLGAKEALKQAIDAYDSN